MLQVVLSYMDWNLQQATGYMLEELDIQDLLLLRQRRFHIVYFFKWKIF